jgi:hypothetical protein
MAFLDETDRCIAGTFGNEMLIFFAESIIRKLRKEDENREGK